MQPDIYTPFIIASYATAVLILSAVVLHTVWAYCVAKRQGEAKKKSRS